MFWNMIGYYYYDYYGFGINKVSEVFAFSGHIILSLIVDHANSIEISIWKTTPLFDYVNKRN